MLLTFSSSALAETPSDGEAPATATPTAAPAAAPAKETKKPLSGINRGPFGYWKHVDDDTGKTDSIFKVWRENGELKGRIVKMIPVNEDDKPNPVCTECEGERKNQPIEGMLMIWGFHFDKEDKKWVEGKILNPEDGKVYNSEITLTNKGLEVYGYIRVIVKIGGTSIWTRPTPAELEGVY